MNDIDRELAALPSHTHPLRRCARSHGRAGVMIACASALALLTAGCAKAAAPSASSAPSAGSSTAISARAATTGAIRFPATLFGLRQDTSAEAQTLDQQIAQMLVTMGIFGHPHFALYGSMNTGDMFIVGVTQLTAAAKTYGQPVSPASLRTGFLVQGSQDSQSFPAGASGALLGCGHVTRTGVTVILCLRYSSTDIGMAMYFNGSAASLSDAAAKTSQAISAIGA